MAQDFRQASLLLPLCLELSFSLLCSTLALVQATDDTDDFFSPVPTLP